jgi:glycosyltransferase involved in cell wall biosynthesis
MVKNFNQKNYPLVSVIIPTFNRAGTIKRAIKSVINQTYKNWELIIVDDGSTDDTKDLIKDYLKNKRIKYYFKKKEGTSSARNYGIKKAKGSFISLLDSDDEYKPKRLEIQLKAIKIKKTLFSLSNRIISINNKRILKNYANHFISKKEVIKGDIGLSASLMLFKKVALKNIKFDEKLPAGNDLDFILRVMNKYNILYINNPLTFIHKTLDYERVSTDPKNKILSYKIILNKIKKDIYKLNNKEKKLFLNNIYYRLGIFNLLNKNYQNAKYYFKINLENNSRFSKKYLKNLIPYLIAHFPFIFNIELKIAKKLWRKGKIGPIKI